MTYLRSLLLLFLKCCPTVCVLFLILWGCSVQVNGYPLLPALYLIPVYYWLIFRPSWLPIASLVGIGLFYDALMGRELGLSSALLLFSSYALSYGHLLLGQHGFYLTWVLFSVYSFVCLGIYGLYGTHLVPLCGSWLYGILLYPFITWGLSHLHLRLRSYV